MCVYVRTRLWTRVDNGCRLVYLYRRERSVTTVAMGPVRRLHGIGRWRNVAVVLVDMWWCCVCRFGLGFALLPCVLALSEARRPRAHWSPPPPLRLYLLYII